MKNERPVQEWQRPLAFLAEAPLGWLMPRGQINHFSPDSPVVGDDNQRDWAFLVLSGSCQLRRNLPGQADAEILRTFKRGETFGGYLQPGTTLVATENSAIFCIRLRDLVDSAPKVNGHTGASDTSDTTRFTFTLDAPKGKFATLAFFSSSLPEKILAENIARRLHLETNASVLLVQLVASAEETTDCVLDDGFVLPTELPEIAVGLRRLRIEIPGAPPAPEILGELLRNLHCRFDYVLLSVPTERVPTPVLLECIQQSRTVYAFLRRNSEDLYHLDLRLHDLQPALKNLPAVEFKSVLCLTENENVAGFDTQIEKVGIAPHFLIRRCPLSANDNFFINSSNADIRRIARSIGNCLVGLALSSGAAKGFSHVGVLQVLEENGIEPDVIAGASMGAYVGALWAFGCDGAQLEKLARDMEGKWSLWNLIDPVFPPRQGFLRGYAAKQRLQQTIGDVQFSDLLRPLHVLATNLDTLGRVVFSSGDVATAVHTSIAVPGIFVPVRIGEESFVDGGIVDPLPVDVLQEMGVHKIIAVNAMPSSDRIRACLQVQRELVAQTPARRALKLARKLLPFNQHVNYFAQGNILEILMNSIHGAQIRMAEASCQRANVVLRPDVGHDRWVDFRNPRQYIAAGREIALQQLDEIKSLVQAKGTIYEHQPAPEPLAAIA
ncbi:MAG TPA: patatin-like phospholipase family protein [Verrucomicrobiae bacterium]